jgi:hypothetical protein
MTQEQKRIKLAEAGGLKVIDVPFIPNQTKANGCVFTDAARTQWRECYPNSCGVYTVPDYFTDLNAVHELELKVFQDSSIQLDYSRSLIRLIKNSSPLSKQFFSDFDLVTATAAQRCEAIGTTLRLWEARK